MLLIDRKERSNMKFIDYVIAAILIGCMFIGYSGHRLVAILLLSLVAIVASWRFWDRRRQWRIALEVPAS